MSAGKKNRHGDDQSSRRQESARSRRAGNRGKVAVIGAIARKGMVVAKVIENTDTETLDSFVHSASPFRMSS